MLRALATAPAARQVDGGRTSATAGVAVRRLALVRPFHTSRRGTADSARMFPGVGGAAHSSLAAVTAARCPA